MLEADVPLEPWQLGLGESLYVDPVVGTAYRGRECDEYHLKQVVVAAAINTGVCNIFKVLPNNRGQTAGHEHLRAKVPDRLRRRVDFGPVSAILEPMTRSTCDCPDTKMRYRSTSALTRRRGPGKTTQPSRSALTFASCGDHNWRYVTSELVSYDCRLDALSRCLRKGEQ